MALYVGAPLVQLYCMAVRKMPAISILKRYDEIARIDRIIAKTWEREGISFSEAWLRAYLGKIPVQVVEK